MKVSNGKISLSRFALMIEQKYWWKGKIITWLVNYSYWRTMLLLTWTSGGNRSSCNEHFILSVTPHLYQHKSNQHSCTHGGSHGGSQPRNIVFISSTKLFWHYLHPERLLHARELTKAFKQRAKMLRLLSSVFHRSIASHCSYNPAAAAG